MNSTYLKKLFDYDFWANEKVFNALEAMPSPPEEALRKMSHILMAKATWFSRMATLGYVPDLNQVLTLSESRKLNGELKAHFESFLAGLPEGKWSEKIVYKNTKGVAFETQLIDILTQVSTHGPYHRGQIATLIKKAGGVPPSTDYIGYVRE